MLMANVLSLIEINKYLKAPIRECWWSSLWRPRLAGTPLRPTVILSFHSYQNQMEFNYKAVRNILNYIKNYLVIFSLVFLWLGRVKLPEGHDIHL